MKLHHILIIVLLAAILFALDPDIGLMVVVGLAVVGALRVIYLFGREFVRGIQEARD